MKASWRLIPYEIPLVRPYVWAKGKQSTRSGLLVACSMEDVVGWGEVAPPPHLGVDGRAIAAYATKALRVPMAQEDVPAALDAAGCGPRLRSGLAGAWLDAEARVAGRSLAEHVAERVRHDGKAAEEVPVNGLVVALSPSGSAEEARRLAAAGHTTLKVKAEGHRMRDVARTKAIREAVGNAVQLRLDANGAYAPQEALAFLRDLEPFDLQYVEQPVAAAHPDALVRLLESSPVPIALDESVTGWREVAPFMRHNPWLILKPQRLGGIDRTVRIMAQARGAKLRCVVTNSLETAVGRAHALHAASLLPTPLPACGLATGDFLAHDVARLETHSGRMMVPKGPGLGINAEVPVAVDLER